MPPVVSEVFTRVPLSCGAAFQAITALDVPRVFRGHGPLPAVEALDEPIGNWESVGHSRRICLSDGSHVRETLTAVDRPRGFSYVVEGFSGVIRWLTLRATGQWTFEAISDRETLIRWRYAYEPRSAAAWPLLWLVNQLLWRGYMRKVIDAIGVLLAAEQRMSADR